MNLSEQYSHNFLLELEKETDELIRCTMIFDEFENLLTKRLYNLAEVLMSAFLKAVGNPSELKSVLVISKSFKEHETFKETRGKLVKKLENILGHKLH